MPNPKPKPERKRETRTGTSSGSRSGWSFSFSLWVVVLVLDCRGSGGQLAAVRLVGRAARRRLPALTVRLGLPRPLLGPLAQVLRRDIARVRTEHPDLAERIGHAAHPIAPELVAEWHRLPRARLQRAIECRVDVGDVKHERGGWEGVRPRYMPPAPPTHVRVQ